MTRIRAALPLLLVLASVARSQSPDPALAAGLQLLAEGRTTLEEKSLASARDYFTQLTQKFSGDADYFYQLARVDSYLVESRASRGEKKNAETALDDAISSAQRAISLNDKSADAHSLLADLYGRKISFGGFFSGPRYGPKADAENKKALALDPNNPRVFASLGRQRLHAPKMFGGNVDEAIASLRRATELDPNFDETFVWLAIAYRKKGDPASADKALQEALRLNPRSAFARRTAGK